MPNHTDKGGARQGALTVAAMMAATVLSKLLGMLRSVFMANAYGTTEAANAFTAAYRIPNSIFDILFSAAIVGCFVPVYSSFDECHADERSEFARVFLNFILLFTGTLALLGIIFARQIVAAFTPGLTASAGWLAAALLRVSFPSIVFIGAAYTLVGVMQSKGRFLLPAAMSLLSNLIIILYFIFVNGRLGEWGIYGLAVAYLIAWLAQLLTLAVPLAASGSKYELSLDFKNAAFRRALAMMPSVMAGSWLLPAGNLVATFFASLTGSSGDVSAFDYAWNIYIIIAGTLVYSLCQYVFPKLSRRSAEGDSIGFGESVSSGMLALWALILPFVFGAFILAREGVAALLLRGAFDASDAESVSAALRMLLFAVPAFAANEMLSRVFYSRADPAVAAGAAAAGIAGNVISCAIMVSIFRFGLGGVALSGAVGQYVSAAVLLAFAAKKIPGLFSRGFFAELLKGAACSLISAGVMAATYAFMPGSPYERGLIPNILVCAAVFLPAAVLYALMLWISGYAPLLAFRSARAGEKREK